MMRFFIIGLIATLISHRLFAQEITVSGTVRDATTGELLIGANVFDSLSASGVQTNPYGFFSIKLPHSTQYLRVSYVGYTILYLNDYEKLKSPLDIRLKPANDLNTVTITENTGLTRPAGSLSMPVDRIRSMPALLGEADVLKALSLTPGVSSGTEGSAGLYVRGGTPDQNLILLDEVPVYNVTHLGGFFSVFNPNSLKSVELYKGAFPARYGGRLASIIDLTMKDGNNQKFGGEVSTGLLNQNLTLEGPIIKNKASFIVSGRISTLGLTTLLKKKKAATGSGENYSYRFYDLNAKINYQISKTDQIFISVYNGFDRFKYEEWYANTGKESETALGNNWGNTTATIRYSKIFSQKLFARFALLYSKYSSEFTNDFEDKDQATQQVNLFYRNTNAGVTDVGGKIQFDYLPSNSLSVKAGIDATRHYFSPFVTKSNYVSLDNNQGEQKLPATRIDGYLDGDFTLSKRVHINAGFRFSLYKVRDQSFYNPEPRLGVNWSLSGNWMFKAGYSVMNQYIHLLTNNGYGFGYDAWLPSTDKVLPSRAKQLSLGIFKTLPIPGLEFSMEVYTKKMVHLIDYPEGTSFTGMLAGSWDDMVVKGGIGRVKGVEFMVNKNAGKFDGWLSYTWSKSERKFAEINSGSWYPMKYDRRHNVSVTGSYALSKKWKLSSTFIYQTGHAVTLPDAAILTEGNPDPRFIYNGRNNARMPDFHRLDLGATRFLTTAHNRKAQLNFGLYNAYNRNNPLYLDFNTQRDTNALPTGIKIKQYSMFPILPYISYNLNF